MYPQIGMDLGINGWFRMRLTSATTAAALSFIVIQSMNSPIGRSGAFPDIAKARWRELRSLKAVGKEIPHHLVCEEQHAAVSVVNDEELIRTEQLVRDD